jgi:hypothetical protein
MILPECECPLWVESGRWVSLVGWLQQNGSLMAARPPKYSQDAAGDGASPSPATCHRHTSVRSVADTSGHNTKYSRDLIYKVQPQQLGDEVHSAFSYSRDLLFVTQAFDSGDGNDAAGQQRQGDWFRNYDGIAGKRGPAHHCHSQSNYRNRDNISHRFSSVRIHSQFREARLDFRRRRRNATAPVKPAPNRVSVRGSGTLAVPVISNDIPQEPFVLALNPQFVAGSR